MVEVATLAITWTEALNRRDAERLRDLSAAEIELLGPKGKGKGHELLFHWLGRAGATFQTVKVFARGNAAVLDQIGTWIVPPHLNETYSVASVYRAEGGKISFYARHDTLDEALKMAGLDRSDERHL